MLTFTIITCTYNASQYIDRTLDSVLRQTYPHIDHLIIDGLSKDDTMEKVKKYAEMKSPHSIRIICEKDNGLYDAMNKGIDLSVGHFLIFLNAGDTFASATTLADIAKQVEGMKELPAVIYGDTDIVNEAGEFIRKRRLAPPEHLNWKSFKHGMLVCHQSFYANTDICKHVHYDMKYRLSADVDWCIRVMKLAEQNKREIHNSHLTLCSYLDGGMSVKNHRASLIERLRVMQSHYGLFTAVWMHLWFVIRAFTKK